MRPSVLQHQPRLPITTVEQGTVCVQVVEYIGYCSCFRREQPTQVCAAQRLPLVVWTDETRGEYLDALQHALLHAGDGQLVSAVVLGDDVTRRVMARLQTPVGNISAGASDRYHETAASITEAIGYVPHDNYFLFAVSARGGSARHPPNGC